MPGPVHQIITHPPNWPAQQRSALYTKAHSLFSSHCCLNNTEMFPFLQQQVWAVVGSGAPLISRRLKAGWGLMSCRSQLPEILQACTRSLDPLLSSFSDLLLSAGLASESIHPTQEEIGEVGQDEMEVESLSSFALKCPCSTPHTRGFREPGYIEISLRCRVFRYIQNVNRRSTWNCVLQGNKSFFSLRSLPLYQGKPGSSQYVRFK